jgi:hypothetical protein
MKTAARAYLFLGFMGFGVGTVQADMRLGGGGSYYPTPLPGPFQPPRRPIGGPVDPGFPPPVDPFNPGGGERPITVSTQKPTFAGVGGPYVPNADPEKEQQWRAAEQLTKFLTSMNPAALAPKGGLPSSTNPELAQTQLQQLRGKIDPALFAELDRSLKSQLSMGGAAIPESNLIPDPAVVIGLLATPALREASLGTVPLFRGVSTPVIDALGQSLERSTDNLGALVDQQWLPPDQRGRLMYYLFRNLQQNYGAYLQQLADQQQQQQLQGQNPNQSYNYVRTGPGGDQLTLNRGPTVRPPSDPTAGDAAQLSPVKVPIAFGSAEKFDPVAFKSQVRSVFPSAANSGGVTCANGRSLGEQVGKVARPELHFGFYPTVPPPPLF